MLYALCIDGSENSDRAFSHLTQLLKPEDTVWLLTCYSPPTEIIMDVFEMTDAMVYGSQDEYNRELELRKKLADKLIRTYRTRLEKHLPSDHIREEILETSDVRTGICEFAEKHNIETLVLGTRGLGKIARLLLGSVSSYVVQHAPCSVLVVR